MSFIYYDSYLDYMNNVGGSGSSLPLTAIILGIHYTDLLTHHEDPHFIPLLRTPHIPNPEAWRPRVNSSLKTWT